MFQRYWALSPRFGCRGHPLPTVYKLAARFRCEGDVVRDRRLDSGSHSQRHATSSSNITGTDEAKNNSLLPSSLSSLNLKYMEQDELRARFDAYDKNSDGSICAKEAIQLVKDADGHLIRDEGNISEKNCAELRASAEAIVRSMDANGDNRVEWSEFKAAVDRAATPVSDRVYPISGTMLINFTGQGVMVPVLPFLARGVGLSTSELGMITASAALARIASNVPAALAAERFGRRPMLVSGPVVGALGMAGFALAPTDPHLAFASFCASNALCGVGSAMTMAGSGLYLTDISTPLNRARTMAPLTMAALAGFMVGPPVGGFIADAYGLQVPFYVTSGALLLTAASALAFLPETMRRRRKGEGKSADNKPATAAESAVRQWRTMLKKSDIQGISAVAFVNGAVQGSYAVTTIIYVSETLGFSTSQAGMMFTASVLAMAAVTKPATDFSDRYVSVNPSNCRSSLIAPGLGIAAAATAMRGLEVFPSALPFTALFVASHLANALLVMPNMTPFLVDSTTEKQRAQALAMRNMAQDTGVLSGAVILGAVSQGVGVPEAILCSAGVQALAAIFFVARTSEGRQKKGLLEREKECVTTKRE